jgi:hypothetical protein
MKTSGRHSRWSSLSKSTDFGPLTARFRFQSRVGLAEKLALASADPILSFFVTARPRSIVSNAGKPPRGRGDLQ